MQKLIAFLEGKKTYIIAFGAAIYGAGIQTGLWSHAPALDLVFAGLGAASMRAAVSKVEPPKQ